MSNKFTKILHISSEEDPDFANLTFEQSDLSVLDVVSKINESENEIFVFDNEDGTFDAEIIEIVGEISKESFDAMYDLLFEDSDMQKSKGFYWIGINES